MKLRRICWLICIALLATGCLKTRSQVRDDQGVDERVDYSQPGEPVPMQPVEVKETHYAVDELKAEIARLTGRIEDLERGQKDGTASDATAKLETRIAELERNQAALLESVTKVKAASGFDDVDTFQRGKMAIEEGNHEYGIAQLTQYLANPKGKHVSEATFLRGEGYYALKDYKKAIVDYSKLPERFPKSKQLPQAMFKIGLSFQNLGMKEDAKSFFQEVVEKHPKSEEAKKSRAYLK